MTTSPSDILADNRQKLHENDPSSRPLSEGYERVGMAGEIAFGAFSGVYPDAEDRPHGDNGVDFTVQLKFSVDVKTARKARYLIHEQGKPFADIYVLAEYSDETGKAICVGWEWGRTLAKAPVSKFGHEVISHYIKREKLRTMDELKERLHKT